MKLSRTAAGLLTVNGAAALYTGTAITWRPDLNASPGYDLAYAVAPARAWGLWMIATGILALTAVTRDWQGRNGRTAAAASFVGTLVTGTWWGVSLAYAAAAGHISSSTGWIKWAYPALITLVILTGPAIATPRNREDDS